MGMRNLLLPLSLRVKLVFSSLTLCSRVLFREERKGKGRNVGGKEKNIVFSSFFKEGKERKGKKIKLIFLPKLSFQMWEEKEGKERK